MKRKFIMSEKSCAYRSRTDPPEYVVIVSLLGKDLGDVVEQGGVVYDRIDHIPIYLEAIPAFRKEALGRAALNLAEKCFAQPGAEEEYQKWLIGWKARESG